MVIRTESYSYICLDAISCSLGLIRFFFWSLLAGLYLGFKFPNFYAILLELVPQQPRLDSVPGEIEDSKEMIGFVWRWESTDIIVSIFL